MIDAAVVVLVSQFALIDVSARLHREKSVHLNVIVPPSQASCVHPAVVISKCVHSNSAGIIVLFKITFLLF